MMEAQVSFKPYDTSEDSINNDSGTDNLYIDLDVTTQERADNTLTSKPYCSPAKESDIIEKDDKAKLEDSADYIGTGNKPGHKPSQSTPVGANRIPTISEYPSPVQRPHLLPPPAGFYPPYSYPMFFPGITSTSYRPFLPIPPIFFPNTSPDIEIHRRIHDNVDPISDTKVPNSPGSDGRTSPADSLSSSGVSSSSSPSPQKSSSVSSPQTPTSFRRTLGGRTCYTPHQVQAMERIFLENRYPDYDVLEDISVHLGIPAKKIKVWFQNKRARSKPRHLNMSVHNASTMMSSTPSYHFPGHSQVMSVPVPAQAPSLMVPYPYPTVFQPYSC